jgi:hypothetical protein
MHSGTRVGLALAIALAVGACSGRLPAPSAPARALIPDMVSFAERIEGTAQTCDMSLVLESGRKIALGGPRFSTVGCPAAAVTPVLFGTAEDMLDNRGEPWRTEANDKPSLVISGTDGDARWLGIARVSPISTAGRPEPCYEVPITSVTRGAWLEGDTVHVGSGPVLPIGTGFTVVSNYEEPWPLREGDYLCLDAQGVVTYAATPAGA